MSRIGKKPIEVPAGVTITVTATSINPTGSNSNGSITASGSGGSGFTYSLNGGTTKTVIGSFTPTTIAVSYPFNSLNINVPSSTTIIFYIVPNSLNAAGTTCRVRNSTNIIITSNPTASVLSSITPIICNGGSSGKRAAEPGRER